MTGRMEHKIKLETNLQEKISTAPDYMKKFYYSMKTKSHTTKKTYINNVIRFLLHKYGEYPSIDILKDIDSYDIQLYMTEIEYFDKGGTICELQSASQAAIYSSLFIFFQFLNRAYNIGRNPFDNNMIERPAIIEKQIVYLTPDEVKKVELQILNGVGNELSVSKQKNWKYRDLLLFRIPVVNGLRVTALSEINIEDINLDERKISVVEKRNIKKEVDFDLKTANYLKLWIKQREELLGDVNEDSLFISNRRTRMTTQSIRNIISKYTECIDGKHITPHKLRSTCGTNSYQATGDIYLVSKILGHQTTAPTRRYAAVLDTDKKNAINKIAELY